MRANENERALISQALREKAEGDRERAKAHPELAAQFERQANTATILADALDIDDLFIDYR